MRTLVIGMVALLLMTSCDPVRRAKRIVKHHPYVIEMICEVDTVTEIVFDTIQIPPVHADTVVITTPQDTFILEKDRLRVKIVRQYDTLIVEGDCLPDTMIVTRTIKVPVTKPPEQTPWWRKIVWFLVAIMALAAAVRIIRGKR